MLPAWYARSNCTGIYRLTVLLPGRQREKGEAQVRRILEAGITTFVCLQVGPPACMQVTPRNIVSTSMHALLVLLNG